MWIQIRLRFQPALIFSAVINYHIDNKVFSI